MGNIRAVRPRAKAKSGLPTEAEDQIKLAVWLAKMGILFTSSANGGKRNFYEAVKLKRMGVSKGYPDVAIEMSNKSYHGLRIELKRVSGGVRSPEQLEWQRRLRENGYCCEFANGLEEAKKIVLDYLQDIDKAA